MSAPARDLAALLLADPHSGRLAFARTGAGLFAPARTPGPGDGAAPEDAPGVSRRRLGAPEGRRAAFMDAALRAAYQELGLLIARPSADANAVKAGGEWGRLARHRLAPDRGALTYLGRGLDPVDAAERRHIRVFTAPLAKVANAVKGGGGADRAVWMRPEAACDALADPTLSPFFEIALGALGGRPRPILISFRAGQRRSLRL